MKKIYLSVLLVLLATAAFAAIQSSYPTKTTPSGSDKIPISDSGASWSVKNVTIQSLWDNTPGVVLSATTPLALDNETGVLSITESTQTGTHASPSTTTPLSPTWAGQVHTVWYGATGTINLPAASSYSGRGIRIYNTGAFTITIAPNGSEVIVRDDGTVQTGGVSMTLASGAGNRVALVSDGTRWVVVGSRGTLAAGS